jgi:type I restriction enzyme S subunit
LVSSDVKNDLISRSTGSVVEHLNVHDIRNFDLRIPKSIDDQEFISEILSSLDDKIDLLHRQNKTLEALAETIFRQWFVEEADVSWEVGRLGDVLELVYGKALKEETRSGKGFPVVGSSGVVGYNSGFLVEGPGIVIGRKGTLGNVIYLFENFFPIDTTYFVKSKVNSVGLFYEYFLLKTMNFEDMNTDSAVPGLNKEIALSMEMKIAPFEKLQDFNDQCSTLFQKLKQNNNQILSLTQLRGSLLPKLMNGEVRVIK